MRVIFRGTSDVLTISSLDITMYKNGEVADLPEELISRLQKDPTILLEVVRDEELVREEVNLATVEETDVDSSFEEEEE